MGTQLAAKAKDAFLDDDFQLAIDLYAQAIAFNADDADLYADRAQARLKLGYFTEAVADANKAIELDASMAKAYLRKGIACIKLGEYHNAKVSLEKGASLAQNDSRFTKFIEECDQHIAEEANDPAESLTPDASPTTTTASTACELSDAAIGTLEEAKKAFDMSHTMNTISPVRPKYRLEYYQKPEEVVVTIFAKGILANNVAVEFGEQILSVTIDVPGEDAYHFQPRLFGKIAPEKCRYDVLSTKVEIRLMKAEGINWPSLEYSKEIAVTQKVNVSSVGSHRPAYPSSMPRKKDWDKLEALVKKEEKEEKLDGDAAVNKLFREIYQNADEDMRRAMSKSFIESNGTVLSTNWKEVGSKKVEGSPPEGMEMKKWEY